ASAGLRNLSPPLQGPGDRGARRLVDLAPLSLGAYRGGLLARRLGGGIGDPGGGVPLHRRLGEVEEQPRRLGEARGRAVLAAGAGGGAEPSSPPRRSWVVGSWRILLMIALTSASTERLSASGRFLSFSWKALSRSRSAKVFIFSRSDTTVGTTSRFLSQPWK